MADDTLFIRLSRLVRFACPGLSEERLWEVLVMRCPRQDWTSEFLDTEEAQTLLEDKDLNDDATLSEMRRGEVEARRFREELAARRPAPKAGAKKRTAAPRTKPPVVSATVTESSVQAVLPPDFRIWADRWNQRWQLSRKGVRVASRSFALYGYSEAASLVTKFAWEWHVAHGGDAPKDAATRRFCNWGGGGAAGVGASSSSGK